MLDIKIGVGATKKTVSQIVSTAVLFWRENLK